MLCRVRGRHLIVAALVTAMAATGATVASGAASKTVKLTDEKKDVSGSLDLQSASLRRARDGRLYAVVTLAGTIKPETLLSKSGPPGSVCLKIWTDPDSDPAASPPDRLVCVTARTKRDLRASVLRQSDPGVPQRVRSASVRQSTSRRSIVLRFSQSSLGRPRLIRFAVESTRPGCDRVSCIDTVPSGGATRRFRTR